MFVMNEKKTQTGKTWSEIHQVFSPTTINNIQINRTGFAVFKNKIENGKTSYKLVDSGLKTKRDALKSAMWVGR